MTWKSREDRLPPPSFFSMIVAYLQQAYRGARISREMMETLRPFFIEAWRNGKTAEAAAQSTCSCDGQQIVPSPVVGVHISKGAVRPPRGAQRGEVFGAEELRLPAPIERLERKLKGIKERSKRQTVLVERTTGKLARSRKDSAKAKVLEQYQKAQSRNELLLAEAQEIERQITRLRAELNSAQYRATSSASRGSADSQPAHADRHTPPAPTITIAESEADTRIAKKRGRKPSAAPAPAPTPAPVESSQDTAMLGALRGLLPDVARQLAGEMNKEGAKK